MNATLQRSNRTGGTTVGSAEIRYPIFPSVGSSIKTLSHTLAADDDPHTVMSHLSREGQKSFGESGACG